MADNKTETQIKAPHSGPAAKLPQPALVYILCVIALSLPVLSLSIYRSLFENTSWIYLAGLTIAASLFAVRIPLLNVRSHSLTISVNDAFVFLAILLFSPEVAAVIAALEGLAGSIKSKVQQTHKKIFNIAVLSLVTFVVGKLVLQMGPALSSGTGGASFPQTLAVVLAGGVLYFLFNSILVATAIALTSGKALAEIWRRNFALLWWAYLINEATAAVVYFYFRPVNVAVLVLAIPLILVILSSRKISLSRVPQQAAS